MSNHLENSNFKNLLFENDNSKIRAFILENGKEGKPFCPIYFEKEGNIDGNDNVSGSEEK